MRLWEVCQTPDFRKTTQDEHARLIGAMFEHLTQGDRRLPEDWMQGQFAGLDRLDGDIDALSTRLARVRTLAYVANRADWLADPPSWQGRARSLEDRLSDTLHQSLMQRFVDRRTSALLRSLSDRAGPILGGIDHDGAVTVEGHLVGRLAGFHFEPERGATALENRALRSAVERVVAPEVARRLGALASEGDEAFALQARRRRRLARRAGGRDRRRRRRSRRGSGSSANSGPSRSASGRRGGSRRSSPPRRAGGSARSSSSRRRSRTDGSRDWRAASPISSSSKPALWTAGMAESRIRTLSRNERRTLKGLGVRFGAFSLYLPSLLTRGGAAHRRGLTPNSPAPAGGRSRRRLTPLPHPAPPPEALSLRGLRAVGGLAAPIAELERLDALARAALPDGAGAVDLTPALLADLGWERGRGRARSCAALGFARVRKGEGAEGGAVAPARGAGRVDAGRASRPRRSPRSRRSPSRNAAAARRARRAKARRRRSPRRRRFVTDDACRIDVWLWRARFFKTRSLAARIVEDGGVRLTRGGARSADRQAEPRGAPRRRAHLRAGAAMAGGEGRGARRPARPGARSARALQRTVRFREAGERKQCRAAKDAQSGRIERAHRLNCKAAASGGA